MRGRLRKRVFFFLHIILTYASVLLKLPVSSQHELQPSQSASTRKNFIYFKEVLRNFIQQVIIGYTTEYSMLLTVFSLLTPRIFNRIIYHGFTIQSIAARVNEIL